MFLVSSLSIVGVELVTSMSSPAVVVPAVLTPSTTYWFSSDAVPLYDVPVASIDTTGSSSSAALAAGNGASAREADRQRLLGLAIEHGQRLQEVVDQRAGDPHREGAALHDRAALVVRDAVAVDHDVTERDVVDAHVSGIGAAGGAERCHG